MAKGSRQDFFSGLKEQFEVTIKTTYRWDNITVEPEIGREFSQTRLILRVTGRYQDYLIIEHARFKAEFSVSTGLNVGLSAQGCEWIAQKCRRQTDFIIGDTKVRDQVVDMGEKDSVSDARGILQPGQQSCGTWNGLERPGCLSHAASCRKPIERRQGRSETESGLAREVKKNWRACN